VVAVSFFFFFKIKQRTLGRQQKDIMAGDRLKMVHPYLTLPSPNVFFL
jgi:hypothetical protein